MLMDWTSFITGAISVAFAFALFTSDGSDEDDAEAEVSATAENDSDELSDTRTVMMSCQTCRKLKKHRELERDLFQCTKCKRHVDLRR
jgi:acetyl-CoA carboxylase beta subunit